MQKIWINVLHVPPKNNFEKVGRRPAKNKNNFQTNFFKICSGLRKDNGK